MSNVNSIAMSQNQSYSNQFSSSSTIVTSTDPTILKNQRQQIQSEIMQLQKNGGSASQIQQLNSAYTEVQKRLTKLANTTSSQISTQAQALNQHQVNNNPQLLSKNAEKAAGTGFIMTNEFDAYA